MRLACLIAICLFITAATVVAEEAGSSETVEAIDRAFPEVFVLPEVGVADRLSLAEVVRPFSDLPDNVKVAVRDVFRRRFATGEPTKTALHEAAELWTSIRDEVRPVVAHFERIATSEKQVVVEASSKDKDQLNLMGLLKLSELTWHERLEQCRAHEDRKEALRAFECLYGTVRVLRHSGIDAANLTVLVDIIERANALCLVESRRGRWTKAELLKLQRVAEMGCELRVMFDSSIKHWFRRDFALVLDAVVRKIEPAGVRDFSLRIQNFAHKHRLDEDQRESLVAAKPLRLEDTVRKVGNYCKSVLSIDKRTEEMKRKEWEMYDDWIVHQSERNEAFRSAVLEATVDDDKTEKMKEVILGADNYFGNAVIGVTFANLPATRDLVIEALNDSAVTRTCIIAEAFRVETGRPPSSWDDVIQAGLIKEPLQTARPIEPVPISKRPH